MIKVCWDIENARFTFFEGKCFSSDDVAKEYIRKECEKNKAKLMKIFIEYDYWELDEEEYNTAWIKPKPHNTDYDAWITWCIDTFYASEELEILA